MFGLCRFFSPQILEKKRKESKTIKHLAIRFWSGYQNWCMLCTYTRDAYANRATLLSTESAIAFLETKAGQSVCTVYNKHPSIIVCNRLGKKICNVATLVGIKSDWANLYSPRGKRKEYYILEVYAMSTTRCIENFDDENWAAVPSYFVLYRYIMNTPESVRSPWYEDV